MRLLLVGVALSPLHTKLAGATWLVACVLALLPGFGTERLRPAGVTAGAGAWLGACLLASGLWFGLPWFWHEPCCVLTADQNAGLRLLPAAFATWIVARRAPPPDIWQRWTGAAVTAACVLGAGLALVENRDLLPSHPIPWAVAMSFLVCLLLPRALDPQEERRARWGWTLGAACGIGAVLASQSRGAFGILAWAVVLAGLSVKRRGRLQRRHLLAALLLIASIAGIAISLPSDPLRARKAWHEVTYAIDTADYNSSLGARVFLFRSAWQGIHESPWFGLGPTELLHRIRHAGEQLPPDQRAKLEHVRHLGHAHNQYLNDTMEGGLLGLGALLALLAGMGIAAVRLGRVNPVASLQMAGLLAMHAVAGLSNVNLQHTYYVVMLSLCIFLVFLHAGEAPATRARR